MRVAILADDLIWSTRLRDLVVAAGAEARPVRSADALLTALPDVDAVVVDLTARAYDGIAAIESARAAARPSSPSDSTTTSRCASEPGAARCRLRCRTGGVSDDGRALDDHLASPPSAIESPA